MKGWFWIALAGLGAGVANGLFGGGGGMVLVPLLTLAGTLDDGEIFPSSVSIILPICILSLIFSAFADGIAWHEALPYLLGSIFGGIASGLWGQKLPTTLLHRALGILILWGGIRYIW